MRSGLFILLLSCSGEDAGELPWPPVDVDGSAPHDPGPDGHEYTEYQGKARFQSAFSADPDSRACDIVWGTVGATRKLCDDCSWTRTPASTTPTAWRTWRARTGAGASA